MSSRPSRGAARLAAILDALPDGLVLVNCNGTVVNANTIALEMFETPGTALVGRGLLDLLPSFDSTLIPGSMRRPESADERGRTKPTRMIARRTDGGEFPVEVTSASLEDGRQAYAAVNGGGLAGGVGGAGSYTGDELLMLVVRDLSGTLDTEAELARSQRQTEMILRAAAEGVVGTDTEGRVVLVNPAAAQILGFRASDLGGRELHPLILHSRPDGEPFPYEDSPLADTLKSGRKHRVRGQVLYAKSGEQVPVDLTTAPVRDGEQLVGAVMTFTDRRPYEELLAQHTAEAAEREERHTTEVTALTEKHTAELDALTEKHTAELADRTERYAAEAEELAEREAAASARLSQLTAVLGESLRAPLEELRGELGKLAADPAGQLWPEANQILHHLAAGYARMTTLVDNVLGFQRLDSGAEPLQRTKALLDGVVAAGVEGAVELIGPGRAQFAVHAPRIEAEVDATRLATALAHLIADVAGVDSTGRTRVVASAGGGYVDSTIVVATAQRGDVVRIEVRGPYPGGDPVHEPIVRGIVTAHGGLLQTHEVPGMSGSAYVLEMPLGEGAGIVPEAPEAPEAAGAPAEIAPAETVTSGGGRRRARARRSSTDAFLESPVAAEGPDAPEPSVDPGAAVAVVTAGTGRRRGRPSPAEAAAEGDTGRPALGATVPPQGLGPDALAAPQPTGRRARRAATQAALPALPAASSGPSGEDSGTAIGAEALEPTGAAALEPAGAVAQPAGRRARRALGVAQAAGESRSAFALPPAEADRVAHAPAQDTDEEGHRGRHEAVEGVDADHTPPQPHPVSAEAPATPPTTPTQGGASPGSLPLPAPMPPVKTPPQRAAQPLPAETPLPADASQGRSFSVRTLGQGVPFAQQAAQAQPQGHSLGANQPLTQTQGHSLGANQPLTQTQGRSLGANQPLAQTQSPTSARRRKLATRPDDETPETGARPHPQQRLGTATPPEGRAYAIGAPDDGAEGPELLDGPGGAIEVANQPVPLPVDDELPPEPLDNPRRLLVWPAPDVATQQALTDRGYRPVIVHSREEVDAQIAAFPAALFVDPLTGPITRTALQSLRQAAVAAEVPVLLAAGLGQASREAAYGADPAVLLKALAPRDSEQHPSRVLLIEENDDIATALAATLERRGMQVARAQGDTDAVTLAQQMRPNLVVMDLMQVRRRRAGVIDWLRANGQLNRTPLVVYTSAGLDRAELPKLSSGETVLFLAERSTSTEVQGRIVDLLAKIGTN
ncbi:PAS domain-containing protein [Streptomyces sp. NPDC019396]|uniref:PAS domain-containing protein n=1 Tax=Streptomyces sp. NPDC019396 TaxID=3154687 RepID=UPI00340FFD18